MRPGTVLNGAWELQEKLGEGGLATVYRGVHVRNGMAVAVKVLHPSAAHSEEIRARFAREGYAANTVPHPGVVRIVGDGIDGDSVYLVMELVEGKSLKSTWVESDRHLPLARVAPIIIDVLDILSVAHHHGVIHRDVKPDNILITSAGQTKLVDFGIARLSSMVGGSSKTATGVVLGTPAFMAPEQALSRWDEVDGRTDLFAVAATAWTLLTGSLVHPGSTVPELLVSAATKQVDSVRTRAPEIPSSVAAVIDRGLAFDKSARYETASAMRDDLRRALAAASGAITTATNGSAPSAVTGNAATVSERAMSRRTIAILACGAALLAGGGGFGIAMLASRSAPPKKAKKQKRSPSSEPATTSAAPPAVQAPTVERAVGGTPPPPACPNDIADLEAFVRILQRALGNELRFSNLAVAPYKSGSATLVLVGEIASYYYAADVCKLQGSGRVIVRVQPPSFSLADVVWSSVHSAYADALSRFQRETGANGAISHAMLLHTGKLMISLEVEGPMRKERYSYGMDGALIR